MTPVTVRRRMMPESPSIHRFTPLLMVVPQKLKRHVGAESSGLWILARRRVSIHRSGAAMKISLRGHVATTVVTSVDLVLEYGPDVLRQLPNPGPLSVTFVKEEECGMRNRYTVLSNSSQHVTKRILTVDDGSGLVTLEFMPEDTMEIVVLQDQTVNLTIQDVSTDPLFTDSNVVSFSFQSTDRDPPTATQLPDPGPISVQFNGEVA